MPRHVTLAGRRGLAFAPELVWWVFSREVIHSTPCTNVSKKTDPNDIISNVEKGSGNYGNHIL